jgi:hypothetical protein
MPKQHPDCMPDVAFLRFLHSVRLRAFDIKVPAASAHPHLAPYLCILWRHAMTATTPAQMAATLEDIRVKNRQLAAANLSQQGAMAEARNQLAIVRSSEYQVGPDKRWHGDRVA